MAHHAPTCGIKNIYDIRGERGIGGYDVPQRFVSPKHRIHTEFATRLFFLTFFID